MLKLGLWEEKTHTVDNGGSDVLWDHLLLSTDVYPDTLTSEVLTVSVFDDNTTRGDTLIGRASTPALTRCIMQGNVGKEVEIKLDLVSTNSKGVEVSSLTHSFLLICFLTNTLLLDSGTCWPPPTLC